MSLEITSGQIARPQRVVHYGPEGLGKSTWASQFPRPLFIDIEQGTSHLDVARTPTPVSFAMVQSIIAELKVDNHGFQTLVVDTADWAERLCINHICAENNLTAIGGQEDYGHSYNLLETAWAKFLDSLTELGQAKAMHIVLLAHAQMRKFELPEEAGAFDRWELKLQKKTSALIKEWPDLLLFGNYKTMVVEIKKSKKAQGGERTMFCTHHPCWDAKNRHGLADELPYTFEAVSHCFSRTTPEQPQVAPATPQEQSAPTPQEPVTEQSQPPTNPELTQLSQLMEQHQVTEAEVRAVVGKRGYYPETTPLTTYAPDFVQGVLVAAWPKVHQAILESRGA